MKYVTLGSLVLALAGCVVAPPPPAPVAYAPAPVYYAQPGYYAYPAYAPGYYGPNVNLDFGFRGRRRW